MRMLRALRHALFTHVERAPWLSLIITAAFGYVQLIGHTDHELWKDELHCYGVGRSADGLWDLLTGERRYDGHPFLWYYVLHLGSRVHRGWMTLPVVSTAVATLAAYVWFRYARVPRLLRLVVLASYYFVYEYGVLSRSYTLGMLFVFIFCALYHPVRIRYVPLAFSLFLIAATSLYGTLIALVLALFLFSHDLGWLAPDASSDRARFALPLPWLLGAVVFVLGMLLVAGTTVPPSDAMYAPSWQFDFSFEALRGDFFNFWAALFPYRTWYEWNWLYVDYLGSGWGLSQGQLAAFGLSYFLLCVFALRRSPKLAVGFALGVFLMMAVQHGIYPAALRHRGHYLILLLACLWLHESARRGRPRAYLGYALIAISVAVQIPTSFAALRTDKQLIFSNAQAAARFLIANKLDQMPAIGSTDHATSPIAIMLDRPMLFQESGETHQVVLEHNRRQTPNVYQIMTYGTELARTRGKALMILNYDNPVPVPTGFSLKLLYRGSAALMYDESYRIYQIERTEEATEKQASAPTPPAHLR
jgi:hypothetical protein